MTPEEMYKIEEHAIELGNTVQVAEWLRTLPNCNEIVAEVRNNSGKYGDTLLMACDYVHWLL